jgi:hypothetical protein
MSRLSAGPRQRPGRDDGRDLRAGHRAVRRLRRLDAPGRSRARVPGHVRDRGAGHPAGDRCRVRGADPRAGAGRAVLLRRRRIQAGRVRRSSERGLAVEAAHRLRAGEQLLQRGHPGGAGGRERRGGRAAVGQGPGLLDARGHGRRRGPGGGVRGGGRRGRPGPLRGRALAGGVEDLPAERARQHHRPARRAAALSRARGGRGVRGAGGVRGGPAGGSAAADAVAADGQRGPRRGRGGRDGRRGPRRDRRGRPVRPGQSLSGAG